MKAKEKAEDMNREFRKKKFLSGQRMINLIKNERKAKENNEKLFHPLDSPKSKGIVF